MKYFMSGKAYCRDLSLRWMNTYIKLLVKPCCWKECSLFMKHTHTYMHTHIHAHTYTKIHTASYLPPCIEENLTASDRQKKLWRIYLFSNLPVSVSLSNTFKLW